MKIRRSTSQELADLYREYHALVRWVVRARGIREAQVEDVVHDVFLTIHRRWPDRDPSLTVRTWIISVARNVAFSERRAAARRAHRDATFVSGVDAPLFEPQLDAKRALHVLQRFLDGLSAPQAEVFVLCDVRGVAAPEVAEALECSVNTVYSRLRLARQRFAARFGTAQPQECATFLQEIDLQEIDRVASPPAEERQRRLASLLASTATLSALPSFALPGAIGAVALSFGLGLAIPSLRIAESRDTVAPPVGHAPAVVASALESVVVPFSPPGDQEAVASAREERPPQRRREGTDAAAMDVGREATLLARAKAELGEGRVDEARDLLEDHRRRFPGGALALERDRLFVDLWCTAQRPEEARRAAERLLGHGDRELPARLPEDPCVAADGSALAVVHGGR